MGLASHRLVVAIPMDLAMSCTRDHTGEVPAAVGKLGDSQAGFCRHKCAGCAYLLGRADAAAAEERLRARVRELEARIDTLEARPR